MSLSDSENAQEPIVQTAEGGPFSEEILDRFLTCSERELFSSNPLASPIVRIKKIEERFELFVAAKATSWSSKFFHYMATSAIVPFQKLCPEVFAALPIRVGACKDRVMVGYCRLEIPKHLSLYQKECSLLAKEVERGLVSERAAIGAMQLGFAKTFDPKELALSKMQRLARFFFQSSQEALYLMGRQLLDELGELWQKERSEAAILQAVIRWVGLFSRAEKENMAKAKILEGRAFWFSIYPFVAKTLLGMRERFCFQIAMKSVNELEIFKTQAFQKGLSEYGTLYHFACVPIPNGRGWMIYGEVASLHPIESLKSEILASAASSFCTLSHSLQLDRNEEEMFRYSLLLASQVKSSKDLPHLAVVLDRYHLEKLFFSAVIVALIPKSSKLIEQLSTSKKLHLENVREMPFRSKELEKKLFFIRGELSAKRFLRPDFTVDYFEARSLFVRDIESFFGEVRDYNGAMMAQERKIYDEVIGSERISRQERLFFEELLRSMKPAHRISYPKEIAALFHTARKMGGEKLKIFTIGRERQRTLFIIKLSREELELLDRKALELNFLFDMLFSSQGIFWMGASHLLPDKLLEAFGKSDIIFGEKS